MLVCENSVNGKFRCLKEDGKRKNAYEISFANSEERDILEDLGFDERIILKCVLNLM
jgi:hypothetical protein